MNIIDISLSIKNNMWAYKSEWQNNISQISSVEKDGSRVYRFNLCSHTGTYVETSKHKLNNNILLEDFPISRFVTAIKLIKILPENNKISLESFLATLKSHDIEINTSDTIIICTGWSHLESETKKYITHAPYFEEQLTEYLAKKNLDLLGVDTPVIDCQQLPYSAVEKLFLNNENLLLLAPLSINLNQVQTGTYILNCPPLKVNGVSASLCRPFLTEFL